MKKNEQKQTKATKKNPSFVSFVPFCSNPQSAIRNPQSAIRNPQSAIRNPQSTMSQFFFVVPLASARPTDGDAGRTGFPASATVPSGR
jgi:hypothetical protein